MTKSLLYMAPIALIALMATDAHAIPAAWGGSMARNIAIATKDATSAPLVLVRGGGRGGGGGRRSDMRIKHDIAYLGSLDNGLGFYRFAYTGSPRAYVGVMAQEVQSIASQAVVRGSDGLLRVRYDLLGLKMQRYDEWVASGAKLPVTGPNSH